jgi:DNA-binding XRE family transcriptional regulator
MSARRDATDLRGRREDLGITKRQMACGLAVSLGALIAMEKGMATDDRQKFYADWLARLEGMPRPQGAIMLARAAAGGRF